MWWSKQWIRPVILNVWCVAFAALISCDSSPSEAEPKGSASITLTGYYEGTSVMSEVC
jgi:hypothetical protein